MHPQPHMFGARQIALAQSGKESRKLGGHPGGKGAGVEPDRIEPPQRQRLTLPALLPRQPGIEQALMAAVAALQHQIGHDSPERRIAEPGVLAPDKIRVPVRLPQPHQLARQQGFPDGGNRGHASPSCRMYGCCPTPSTRSPIRAPTCASQSGCTIS